MIKNLTEKEVFLVSGGIVLSGSVRIPDIDRIVTIPENSPWFRQWIRHHSEHRPRIIK